MSVHPWRLLLDGPASGAWNMGVDEVLLLSAGERGWASLRFYRWRRPCLSLGYAQACEAALRTACARVGLEVVRRATGGRAVLHGGDLTYTLAAPPEALPDGLRATCELVAGALVAGLRALGVDAERSDARRAHSEAFDCFQVPGLDELCAGGRKLVGSAQRRTRRGVLQHGSIRLRPDPAALRLAAGLDPGAATSLSELGCRASPQAVQAALCEAFAAVLGGRLEPGTLSTAEVRAAQRLARTLGPPADPAAPTPRGFSRVAPGRR